MTKKALLFVNGEPPKHFPQNIDEYDFIACTDGSYSNYLKFTPIKPHFIIGDLDSLKSEDIDKTIAIIHTPDQEKNDFEKALLHLNSLGITKFDIYGASGHSNDHFLGNLSVAIQYNEKFDMTFYDNYSQFFLAKKMTLLNNVKNKVISLIPLSPVYNLTLYGFEFPLTNVDLKLGGQISLRNKALKNKVKIEFEYGDLVIFINL